MSVKYFCSSSRAHSLSVSLKRRSRLVMTPSNGFLVVVAAQAVVVGEPDVVVAGAVEDRVLRLLRQVLPLGVEREACSACRARRASACNRARTISPTARSRPCAASASLSGMTRSASMCCSTPRPPHSGQAPNGLLNENSRGSISEMVKPDTGQANFSEKIRRSAFSLRPRVGLGAARRRVGELDHRQALGELQRIARANRRAACRCRRAPRGGRPPRRCRG